MLCSFVGRPPAQCAFQPRPLRSPFGSSRLLSRPPSSTPRQFTGWGTPSRVPDPSGAVAQRSARSPAKPVRLASSRARSACGSFRLLGRPAQFLAAYVGYRGTSAESNPGCGERTCTNSVLFSTAGSMLRALHEGTRLARRTSRHGEVGVLDGAAAFASGTLA